MRAKWPAPRHAPTQHISVDVVLQVRAASLSRDCEFWREAIDRLNFGFRAHFQARRRAVQCTSHAAGVC